MKFSIKNSRGKQHSEIEADTSEDAACLWALEWLTDDEEDRCHVSTDGVEVAKFHMSRTWTAMELKP